MADEVTDEEEDGVFSSNSEEAIEEDAQQIQAIPKSEGRKQMRQLIDALLLSGIEEEEIEDMLRDLADGVEYYSEDIRWYNARDS